MREASHSNDLAASSDRYKRAECNDCNEAARLARVAKNALLNRDFPRVIAVLDLVAALAVHREAAGGVRVAAADSDQATN